MDWQRAPERQASVRVFDKTVGCIYRGGVRKVTSHFIHCRFLPTCSAYAEGAMHVHGFPKGLWLTFTRLLRCGPWTKPGTYDPVPPVAN